MAQAKEKWQGQTSQHHSMHAESGEPAWYPRGGTQMLKSQARAYERPLKNPAMQSTKGLLLPLGTACSDLSLECTVLCL